MVDDIQDIAAYYNNDPERERNRLERHQLEYDLTWRYLNQYFHLKPVFWKLGRQPEDIHWN